MLWGFNISSGIYVNGKTKDRINELLETKLGHSPHKTSQYEDKFCSAKIKVTFPIV